MVCLHHFNHKDQIWNKYSITFISKRVNVQVSNHGMFVVLSSQKTSME